MPNRDVRICTICALHWLMFQIWMHFLKRLDSDMKISIATCLKKNLFTLLWRIQILPLQKKTLIILLDSGRGSWCGTTLALVKLLFFSYFHLPNNVHSPVSLVLFNFTLHNWGVSRRKSASNHPKRENLYPQSISQFVMMALLESIRAFSNNDK